VLFGYILQFLVVLFVYLSYVPGPKPPLPSPAGAALIVLGLAGFALLAGRVMAGQSSRTSAQRWEIRLAGLAVLLFGADVYFLGLKELLWSLPLARQVSALDGLLGLAFFHLYLIALWSAVWRLQRRLGVAPSLRVYLAGQLRWTLPLIMPWFLLAALTDLVDLAAPRPVREVLARPLGELGLVAVMLILLSLFLPPLVRLAWGCRPLAQGEVRSHIDRVLAAHRVKVRDILNWPLLQGQAATAGIMGLLAPVRYLLITPALLNSLSPTELEAVLAHEAGHVRRRHLFFYLFFFLSYLVLTYSLGGLAVRGLLAFPPAARLLLELTQDQSIWSAGLLSLPMLLLLLLYFRFVFAWFMRHFERQADAYAARTVGPGPVITALEKIASLSGLSRRAPSWHHFSIAQRVDFLLQANHRPQAYLAHDRQVRRALAGFAAGLILLIGLSWPAGVWSGRDSLNLRLMLTGLDQALASQPSKPEINLYRAMILLRLDRPVQAAEAYRQVLALEPDNPVALNDLAWLYATGPQELRRPKEAVDLARRAVALAPSPAAFDTLAEACFLTGRLEEAVTAARRALAAGPKENREYYRKQLQKFEKAWQEAAG